MSAPRFRLSVLVPVYDEAGTVRTLLQRVMAVPIPKEPTLMGRTAYVQASILGGGYELCNGLRLVIGF